MTQVHDLVRPYGGANAIKAVSFAIELVAPLTAEAFKQFSALHPQFKNELPRKDEQQSVKLNFDLLHGKPAFPAKPELGGVVFDRLAADGTQEWALIVAEKHITVKCAKYTRWVEVWSRAKGYLSQVSPMLFEHSSVSGIGLQYVDEFVWDGVPNEFRADYIFRRDNNYLVGNAFIVDDLWHSHHGFFRRDEAPHPHKRLTNININIVDQNSSRIAQINSVQRSLLDSPVETLDSLIGGMEASESNLEVYMDAMHESNKAMLRDILLDSIREKIGL